MAYYDFDRHGQLCEHCGIHVELGGVNWPLGLERRGLPIRQCSDLIKGGQVWRKIELRPDLSIMADHMAFGINIVSYWIQFWLSEGQFSEVFRSREGSRTW